MYVHIYMLYSHKQDMIFFSMVRWKGARSVWKARCVKIIIQSDSYYTTSLLSSRLSIYNISVSPFFINSSPRAPTHVYIHNTF